MPSAALTNANADSTLPVVVRIDLSAEKTSAPSAKSSTQATTGCSVVAVPSCTTA